MKTILVDAIGTFSDTNGEIFADLHKLLESYPNKKILVTGANDEQFKLWKLETVPYEVFTLKHNPEKTSPEYFQKLLNQFRLTKDDLVYFEHNPEAVKSAQLVGIESYYFDEKKKDLEALKDFLSAHI